MERHRTIIITAKALMFALSCLAGIVCCAGGIRAIYREKNAGTFEELSLRNCRQGDYISDEIESYLVAPVENGGTIIPDQVTGRRTECGRWEGGTQYAG